MLKSALLRFGQVSDRTFQWFQRVFKNNGRRGAAQMTRRYFVLLPALCTDANRFFANSDKSHQLYSSTCEIRPLNRSFEGEASCSLAGKADSTFVTLPSLEFSLIPH
jgi:hypothetical protein